MKGHTKTPNQIFDLMPLMSDSELKITLAILRQTFGWQKESDRISLSQFMELTGFSKQGVINGINAGMDRGTIKRDKVRGGFSYSLLVNEVDTLEPVASQRSRHLLVNEVDTLEPVASQRSRHTKEKNIKKGKKGEANNDLTPISLSRGDDLKPSFQQINFGSRCKEMGYTSREGVDITYAILDAVGKRKLAEQDTQAGNQEHSRAQDEALTLMGMYEGKLEPRHISETKEYIVRFQEWAAGNLGYGHIRKYICERPSAQQQPGTKSILDVIKD